MFDSENNSNSGFSSPQMPAAESMARNISSHLGELRGLAQLLVYLADQIEETDHRLEAAQDPTQVAFLNRVISMYSNELEKRQLGLTGRISAISEHVSLKVRPAALNQK